MFACDLEHIVQKIIHTGFPIYMVDYKEPNHRKSEQNFFLFKIYQTESTFIAQK